MTGPGFCTITGKPTDHPETHHHNHRRGDNHPDNLRPVDRRNHMQHHENDEAVDDLAKQRYGPPSPRTGPP